ncbi:MAG: OmpP1/FadL family transporter [Campylobacterota bacterium]|nr:OmpP1/FadL family transporter [Campylobacterota bacterium]
MKKIIVLSVVASSLFAGGYKLPEQSLNSMALGGAYTANTTHADTAYFNPANMSFMANKSFLEGGLTLVHLPANEFAGVQAFSATDIVPANGSSEVENIPVPFFHYVSPAYGDFRFGLSVAAPGGLTKRWEAPIQKLFAQEFTLKIVEINPSLSYKINDQLSVAAGIRAIYSEGVVKSDGSGAGKPILRDLEGDTFEFGYNLAMTYQPFDGMRFAVAYRSEVELEEEGSVRIGLNGLVTEHSASVAVPLPASLNIAVSKALNENFTLEFNYERTFWSAYEQLDFNYGSPIFAALIDSFDNPKAKNWEDTSTYRFGATWQLNDDMTLMLGYTYDETPVPTHTLSYELPDSDAHIFSTGLRVKHNDKLSWGVALLYDKKDSITVDTQNNENGIIGEFSDGGAMLATVGVSYEF